MPDLTPLVRDTRVDNVAMPTSSEKSDGRQSHVMAGCLSVAICTASMEGCSTSTEFAISLGVVSTISPSCISPSDGGPSSKSASDQIDMRR